jgi:hypothetical protein
MVPFYNLHKLNDLMYDSMLHNDKDHFTTQNIECFRPGGWIDRQSIDMAAYQQAKMQKKSE